MNLNYAEGNQAAPATKFFVKQKKDREKKERCRDDRYILPVEVFKDPTNKNKKVKDIKLPFSTVDLIFNHKNVWCNLQNENPAKIMYHIHDEMKWLPLILDPDHKHEIEKKMEEEDMDIDDTLVDEE